MENITNKMAQPIRKAIQEHHPDAVKDYIYTLLIDGNNLLRQCFADDKKNSNGVHYGAVFQFFLQVKLLLKKKTYDYVYVTFDDDDSGIFRYQVYNGYKANRPKHYAEHSAEELSDYGKQFEATVNAMMKWAYARNSSKRKTISDSERFIQENFARERDIVLDMCEELCIRTIFNKTTEGDDIIAYYVQHRLPNEKIVIVSTDNDLTQLINDDVCVYNRTMQAYLSPERFKKMKGMPVDNVVVKKIFLGDASDNIGNIYGFSEKKLLELVPDFNERPVTVEEVKDAAQKLIDERISNKKKPFVWCENIVNGKSNKEYDGDFYDINRKLIDLSKPYLSDDAVAELESLMHKPIDMTDRGFDNLYQIIKEEKIEEILDTSRFASFFSEFKGLFDKELKRFSKK